jgi:hypothetical protein
MVIVGDVVFNARCALDHLAMALAVANTPNMTDGQVIGSEFPIFGQQAMSAKQESRKIGCVALAAQDAIKSLQPYHRGNAYGDHPLWLLHEINNIDKHRVLTTCACTPESQDGRRDSWGVGFRYKDWMHDPKRVYVISSPCEVEKDAIVLQFGIVPNSPDVEVTLEPEFPTEITFGQGTPAPFKPVIPLLHSILDFVGNSVITPLSKFL